MMRTTPTAPTTPTRDTDAGPPVLLRPKDYRDLSAETVETLIDCEQRGVPSVLWVDDLAELETPLAVLVTHIAAADPEVHLEAVHRIGSKHAKLAATPEEARQLMVVRSVPLRAERRGAGGSLRRRLLVCIRRLLPGRSDRTNR